MLMYWRFDCGQILLSHSQRSTSFYIHSKSHFVSNPTHWSSWTWAHNFQSIPSSASEAFFCFVRWYHSTKQIKLDLAKAFVLGRSLPLSIWIASIFRNSAHDSYELFAPARSDLIIGKWSISFGGNDITLRENRDRHSSCSDDHCPNIQLDDHDFPQSRPVIIINFRTRSKWLYHWQEKHFFHDGMISFSETSNWT